MLTAEESRVMEVKPAVGEVLKFEAVDICQGGWKCFGSILRQGHGAVHVLNPALWLQDTEGLGLECLYSLDCLYKTLLFFLNTP